MWRRTSRPPANVVSLCETGCRRVRRRDVSGHGASDSYLAYCAFRAVGDADEIDSAAERRGVKGRGVDAAQQDAVGGVDLDCGILTAADGYHAVGYGHADLGGGDSIHTYVGVNPEGGGKRLFSALSLNGVAVAVPGPDGVCAVAVRQHVSKTAPASKDFTIVCGSCVFPVVSWQEG